MVNAISDMLLNGSRASEVFKKLVDVALLHSDQGDCERFFLETSRVLADPSITWVYLRKA